MNILYKIVIQMKKHEFSSNELHGLYFEQALEVAKGADMMACALQQNNNVVIAVIPEGYEISKES